MNKKLLLLIIIFTINNFLLAAPTKKYDYATFLNSDSIFGSVISLSYQQGLCYKITEINHNITFKPDNLESITFHKYSQINKTKNSQTITLTNNSTLVGSIISLTPEKIILNTKYAGQLSIKPAMVKEITFNTQKNQYLYSGPNNKDKWIKNSSTIKIKNKTLYIKGYNNTAKLKIKQKGMLKYEFTTPENIQKKIQFIFLSTTKDSNHTTSYHFHLSNNNLSIEKSTYNDVCRKKLSLFNDYISGLKPTKNIKITILTNPHTKTITILVNGLIVKQYKDKQNFINHGEYIEFSSGYSIQTTIRDIKISTWDGKISQPSPSYKSKTDKITFTNKDQITGTIQSITEQKVHFKTKYATLIIPFQNITTLKMATQKQVAPQHCKNDIKAIFADGNSIIMELLSLKNGIIKAKSEIFSDATFKQSAFKQIILNIYNKQNKQINKKNEEEKYW